MKTTKGLRIALFGVLLLFAGSVTVLAQGAQQSGDQNQADSSTAKKDKDTKAGDAASATTGTSKATTAQKTPPASSAGMVGVNTDSGASHKRGTPWYGKTKKGKYMTEADAIKAGITQQRKNEQNLSAAPRPGG
jgi:hypothetical protein